MTRAKTKTVVKSGGSAGAVYGLGFIGALIYFWQNAQGIGEILVGFLEALVWPAYFVYKSFESFKLWG